MGDIGQKFLNWYNDLADTIIAWEVEQIGKGVTWLLSTVFSNMDVVLPTLGLISLFVFKPTRTYAFGSLALGLLFL
jgi:hypothetical protein